MFLVFLHRNILFKLFALFIFLTGCSTESGNNKIPAVFDTKAEAERAAKRFNCVGAHKMGDKWMPCESHKAHEEHKEPDDHEHHHKH